MTANKFFTWMLLVLLTSGFAAHAADVQTVQLFSEEDAAELRLSEEDIGFLSAQSKAFSQGGPEIEWLFPRLSADAGSSADKRVRFESPSSLTIQFKETMAPIDFDTLDVRGRKFGFSKSVTELVRPYLDGQILKAENIELPKGKFLVEVTIEDVEGRKTTRPFFVHSR